MHKWIGKLFLNLSLGCVFVGLSSASVMARPTIDTCPIPSRFIVPSLEKREIRLEKHNILFQLPTNYRTRSYPFNNSILVFIYEPASFSYEECLIKKQVPADGPTPAMYIAIESVEEKKSLIEIARRQDGQRTGRRVNSIENISTGFGRQAVLLYQQNVAFGSNSDDYQSFLFLRPGDKQFVEISYVSGDGDIDWKKISMEIMASMKPIKNPSLPVGLPARSNSNSAPAKPIPPQQKPLGEVPRSITNRQPESTASKQPTTQEIALINQQARNRKNPLEFNPSQLKSREILQAQTSKYLDPFVGGWITADNQNIFVYPSTKKERQACIIVEKGDTQDLQIGVTTGNAVGTDMNIGKSRLFNIKQPNVLALRQQNSDKPIPVYAAPIAANLTQNNREAMEKNGCITQFPGTSPIAKTNPEIPSPTAQKNANLYTYKSPEDIEYVNMNCFDESSSNLGRTGPGFCTTHAEKSRFVIDQSSIKTSRESDKSVSIEMEIFNPGAGDGLLEIYDSQGKLKDIKRIEGTQPPSGFVQTLGDVFTAPARLFGKYPMDDPRYSAKSTKFIGENKIKVPRKGFVKLTKTSRAAIAYNSLITTIDLLAALGQLEPSAFAEAGPSVRYRKIALLFAKEASLKAGENIFKSEPTAKSLDAFLDLNNLDMEKAIALLQDFLDFTKKVEEDSTMSTKAVDNPIFGALYGVTEEITDEGIEIAANRLAFGLGELIKLSRQATGFLNAFSKASDLYYSQSKIGDDSTVITIKDVLP